MVKVIKILLVFVFKTSTVNGILYLIFIVMSLVSFIYIYVFSLVFDAVLICCPKKTIDADMSIIRTKL